MLRKETFWDFQTQDLRDLITSALTPCNSAIPREKSPAILLEIEALEDERPFGGLLRRRHEEKNWCVPTDSQHRGHLASSSSA